MYGSLLFGTGKAGLYTFSQEYSERAVISISPEHRITAVDPEGPLPQLDMYILSIEVIPIVGSKVLIPIP